MSGTHLRLHQAQWDFMASRAVFRGFVGGRGAGKSYVGSVDLLARANRGPEGRMYGLYAPTFPMLRDSALRSFVAVAAPWIEDHNKSDGIIRLAGNKEIICRSLDNPESARGPNLSGAWIDEASLVSREAWDIVVACLREGGEQGWASCTFTPRGRSHWTYDVFGTQRQDAAIFHAGTRDNPFLPASFADVVAGQYTSQFAAQELDGKFVDMGGAMANREWFKIVDARPAGGVWVRAWDFAATAKESADYTVGTLVGHVQGRYVIADVIRRQIAGGEVERVVRAVAQQDGQSVAIALEQEPGSSGKIASAALIKSLAGYNVRAIPVTGDKASRALPLFAQAEAGNVQLVRGPWINDWFREIEVFPNGEHDDQVDSAAHGFNWLVKGHVGVPVGLPATGGITPVTFYGGMIGI